MFNIFNKTKAYKNITAEEFKKLKDENPGAVILDVRTPGEVRQGKIPGAKNLELTGSNFTDEIQKLDKNKTYLVYCRSGARSGQACDYMSGLGFKNLYNLSGGISRWPYETKL